MKIFLVIILFSITTFGCKNYFIAKQRKKNCDSVVLKKTIDENWKYNEQGGYYMTSDSFVALLKTQYHDCFFQQNSSLINRYFGKIFTRKLITDNDSIKLVYEYAITPPESSFKKIGANHYWSVLNFYFDENFSLLLIEKQTFKQGLKQ